MTGQIAFIGDIHGHSYALECILRQILRYKIPKVVLLGDYINKGPHSKDVLDFLIGWDNNALELIPLLGNHEETLLRTLRSGDLRSLLKLGGAPTVRSYVGEPVGPDAFADFSAAFPATHKEFLESLTTSFVAETVKATHKTNQAADRYHVSAHRYIGLSPKIGRDSAAIDTGCGASGYLTAFLWPSRNYLQCTEEGTVLKQ